MSHAQRLRDLAARTGLDGFAEELLVIAGEIEAASGAIEEAAANSKRFAFAMDPDNTDFAVCRWIGGAFSGEWWPIDGTEGIDKAMAEKAEGGAS